MFCQIAFSADSFERLIKYRIADLFRPLATPVAYPDNAQSWLDGVIVTHIDFNRVDQDRFVLVNVLDALGSVSPQPGYGYHASAVAMELAANIFFARVEDVAAAGLAQPPVLTKSVPVGLIHITIRASVGSDGIPVLQMELDTARLSALDLPAAVVAGIAAAGTASFQFDIGSQLKDIFPPGNNKVLNAGITRDDGGAIVLRFTFPGQVWQSALAHSYEWEHFHGASYRANLGADAWCMDLDGGAVASGLATIVNPAFKDDKPVTFDSSGYGVDFIDGMVPRVVITKNGRVENACAGNDVRFDAFANIDLSVPSNNLFRGTLGFDIDKNDWDVAKCIGLTMANPLSVFITAVDNGQLGIGLAELAISFVFPTRAFLVGFALQLLLAGVDKDVVQYVIAERLNDQPTVTKLPNGGFAFDKPLKLSSTLTKDWLVLKKCVGSAGRMLLSGELRVPDAILPRLTASDLEGLSKWILADRCSPGKGQVSRGSLGLALAAGYGADAPGSPPAAVPTIPLKWGVRPTDGGELVFQVLNDNLGVYQDPEFRTIFFPGIPGKVEVSLKAATVRKLKYSGFATTPYPLRLRFFTNGGVREYQFAAPPVFTDFAETIPQTAERINKCKQLGASLLFREYLELKWRVDPPAGQRAFIAQQWDVHVRGLQPGRKATVWSLDTGEPLVHVYADQTGRVDVSLLLRADRRAGGLLMGLDDRQFKRQDQVRQPLATENPDACTSAAEVVMQQTLLTEVESLQFDEEIQSLGLIHSGPASTLVVGTVHGRHYARAIPSPYSAGRATPMATATAGVHMAQAVSARSSSIVWRGKQRQFMLVSQRSGRTEVLAEYLARSSHDLGAGRDDLFAQVSSDGRRVRLFHKGVPVQFGTHEWQDSVREG